MNNKSLTALHWWLSKWQSPYHPLWSEGGEFFALEMGNGSSKGLTDKDKQHALYQACPGPFITSFLDGDILISLDPSAMPNTGIAGRGSDFKRNRNRCLRGGTSDREERQERGNLMCG